MPKYLYEANDDRANTATLSIPLWLDPPESITVGRPMPDPKGPSGLGSESYTLDLVGRMSMEDNSLQEDWVGQELVGG